LRPGRQRSLAADNEQETRTVRVSLRNSNQDHSTMNSDKAVQDVIPQEERLELDASTDLTERTEAQMPVCFVVDVSGSIAPYVADLNASISAFCLALGSNHRAKEVAEIAIVTFGDGASVFSPFRSVKELLELDERGQIVGTKLPAFDAVGRRTAMGQGLRVTLDLVDRRRKEYDDAGVQKLTAFVVVFTDGGATDETAAVVKEMSKRVLAGHLHVFPIAVGGQVDMAVLKAMSPQQEPTRVVSGTEIVELLDRLSAKVIKLSAKAVTTNQGS